MKMAFRLLVSSVLIVSATSLNAEILRWARAGDALTLDPHAQNEGPTQAIHHQIYEPLIIRGASGTLEAALAVEWGIKEDAPNTWVFKLRKGVKFQDGDEFTAEDVVFSLERAQQPDADVRELVVPITEVRAVDDYTVELVTNGPNPILPANLANLFMMDKDWTEANDTVKVQDFEGGEITFATTNANGTGPYKLQSREPGVKTVMVRNDNYWGIDQFPMDITKIIYTPIKKSSARVGAIIAGEVNFLQDVPIQYIERVRNAPGLIVKTAPQNMALFFGLNMGADDIKSDNIEGKNPLADVRVRRAMSMVVNREAIQQVVMFGQSVPAGMIVAPFVNGWTAEMNTKIKTDIVAAKALMKEAGYGDGFSIRLDCPGDRYINDEAICKATVGMFGLIGIKVDLAIRPKAEHFPLTAEDGKSDFYMLGWGTQTYDSEYAFNSLVRGREEDIGTVNNTGFNNEEINAKIESLASNIDLEARNADIAAIWRVVQDEQLYIPIHYQVLNWGMSEKFDIEVDHDDQPKVKYIRVK